MLDVIKLCKNWDEFFEVNILAMFGFFPNPLLTMHIEDDVQEQMLRMGFVVHARFRNAVSATHNLQTRRHSGQRRQHDVSESRSWIAGQMSRNDEKVRRFIRLMSMRPNEICIYARDMETGRVLVQPPENERWLVREKVGLGRSARNQFNILEAVDAKFFRTMHALRGGQLPFNDYYAIVIWHREPGRSWEQMQYDITEVIMNSMGSSVSDKVVGSLSSICDKGTI